ncbi:hypothetical protein LTR97_010135 [Elasticomyces elasticus]|uniref:Myb-like domain-containing protein n=1 Tax=Elasticomyces elasticus TaxID=574655 RepID=A0AAN7VYY8_9PEZI|nr:hypothetical protein LTR97_010135 [Elasticomyces elasticus]
MNLPELACATEWRSLPFTKTLHAPRAFGARSQQNTATSWSRPARRHRPWTQAEDDLIVTLRSGGWSTPAIVESLAAKGLGVRSYQAVVQRILKTLGPAGKVEIVLQRSRFTHEERVHLMQLKDQGVPLPSMLSIFPGRTEDQIRNCIQSCERRSSNGPFTDAEDKLLAKLREQDQMSWNDIASRVLGRDAYACCGRYRIITPLSARATTRSPRARTAEEVTQIRQLREEGMTFQAIADHTGLTLNSVAGLYYSHTVQDTFPMRRRSHQPFTKEDDVELRELKSAGRTFEAIQKLTGRSVSSLRWRWNALRIQKNSSSADNSSD